MLLFQVNAQVLQVVWNPLPAERAFLKQKLGFRITQGIPTVRQCRHAMYTRP